MINYYIFQATLFELQVTLNGVPTPRLKNSGPECFIMQEQMCVEKYFLKSGSKL